MAIWKNWLLGVVAVSMLLALAEGLTPKGAVRKIGKLTGGLVLIMVILRPVLNTDDAVLAGALSRFREDLGNYQVQPKAENYQLMKSIIESRSAAYIQDKATGLGIICRVSVTCGAQTAEGYPYPTQTLVEGELSEAEIQKIKQLIEADLAVPVQFQTYRTESGEIP